MNILFLIYNRPEYTLKVFEKIKEAKPERLFFAADGPSAAKSNDQANCIKARSIIDLIDWPCEVKTLFRENNLGCKMAVSTAISWFFEQVEEGIILEDDCLPDQSFFLFATQMLEKYRNDPKIMHINGTNFMFGRKSGEASYYFSHCPHIWGWASWRRAWKNYDIEMKDLDGFISSKRILDFFDDKKSANFWISLFKHIKDKNVDTWDAQWAFAVMKSEGLAVAPNVNMVKNLDDKEINPSVGSMTEIKEPTEIKSDKTADTYLTESQYLKSPAERIINAFIRLIK